MPSTSHGKQKQVDRAALSHYLISIHELVLLTIFPEYQPEITTAIYSSLLASHAAHFREIANPFGSANAASRSAVQSGSTTFPGTDVTLEVYDGEGKIACLISDRLGIDEIEALVLFRRFRREEHELMEAQERAEESQRTRRENAGGLGGPSQKSKPLSETLLNLIVKFYWQEHIALGHLLSALLRRSSGGSDVSMDELLGEQTDSGSRDIKMAATEVLEEVIGQDRKAFVYNLFRQFGTAMQTVVDQQSEEMTRAGVLHYLEVQVSILESLLLYNYYVADITANLSRGLINGSLACGFGAAQANSRLIERLPGSEAPELLAQIQHLLALICIDSLRINALLQEDGIPLEADLVQNIPEGDRTLAQSPQHIASVHDHLGTAACRDAEPYALLLLAWACFLGQLQDQRWLLPGGSKEQGANTPLHVTVGQIALDPQMDVFGKWQRLLTGRLLWQEQVGSSCVEDAAIYKDISRGLLSALPQLVKFGYIPDYYGLVDVWTCCYGQGDAQSVAELCCSAWQEEVATGWQDLLNTTQFPYHARTTMRLLAAMTGAGSVTSSTELLLADAAASTTSTLEYLQAIPAISVEIQPESRIMACCDTMRYDDGAAFLVNRRPLRLPGGSIIAARSIGRIISKHSSSNLVVRWEGPIDGLSMLVAIVGAATGHRSGEEQHASKQQLAEDRNASQPASSGLAWLTISDIGVTNEILQEGQLLHDALLLLQALLRGEPAVGGTFARLSASPTNPGGLSAILLRLVKQRVGRGGQHDVATLVNISAATEVVVSLAQHSPGPVWDLLRKPGFFADSNGSASTARVIMALEMRTGSYQWTLAMLNMLHVLSSQFLSQRLSEPADVARQQEEAVCKAMTFVQSQIWTDFGNWRYAKPGDRAIIGTSLCNLMLLWIQDPLVDKALQGGVAGGSIVAQLLESFISAPSTLGLQPLLDAVATPSLTIPALLRRNRKAEAAQTESCLVSSLILLEALLRRSRRTIPRSTALETMLTTPVQQQETTRRQTLVDILFHYSSRNTTLNEKVGYCSLRVNNTLAGNLASMQYNSAPMLTCLSDANATMSELVALVTPPYSYPSLVKEAWAFLRTAAISQPGLARIAAGSGEPSNGGTAMSALGAALEVVENAFSGSGNSWGSDPQLLTACLSFLVALRRCMPDAFPQARFEDNSRLWIAVDRLCRSIQATPPLPSWSAQSNETTTFEATYEQIEKATTYAHRRAARALALDLLVCSFTAESDNKGRQCALKLLADGDAAAGLIAEAAYNGIAVDVHREVYSAVLPSGQGTEIDDLKDQRQREDREFGTHYLFDIDACLVTLGRGRSEHDTSGLALQIVNVDWSTADADAQLTSSWTSLLEAACPAAREQQVICKALLTAASRILPQLRETRRGFTINHIQGERLGLLRAVLAIGCAPGTASDKLDLDEIVDELIIWLSDQTWSPQALAREAQTLSTSHVAFQVILLIIGKLAASRGQSLDAKRRQVHVQLITAVANATASALVAGADAEGEIGVQNGIHDTALLYAVLHAATATSINPDGPIWLHTLEDKGVLRQSLASVGSASLNSDTSVALITAILQFHAGAVQHLQAASALQRLRLTAVYEQSAVLTSTSSLYVSPTETVALGTRHALWTQALTVVNDLFVTLSATDEVSVEEVLSIIDRVRPEAAMTLSWDLDVPHPIERLSDVRQVVNLFYHLVRVAGSADRSHEAIMKAYAPQALSLLNAVAAAFGTSRYLRQVVHEAMQERATALEVRRDLLETDVDKQVAGVKACLLEIGHVVVQTLMSWTGTMHILRRDQDGFLGRTRRLLSLPASGFTSPVQELLDFAAAVTEEGDGLLAIPLQHEESEMDVVASPAASLAELTIETVEMATLVAAGQAVLLWEDVSEATRLAAEKASDGTGGDGEGKTKGVRAGDEMSGQDKQSLRDLKDFISKMADKEQLYRDCYMMLRHRIPQMDDL